MARPVRGLPGLLGGNILSPRPPEGFRLVDEVMNGNTNDSTTLKDFLDKIENQHGRTRRAWVMDRGIPIEDSLRAMREADDPVSYLVGTPRG